MAKTYGELILEYQNYEHSKENYELTKECYELQLMDQYIKSQQFMAENMSEIREEFSEFDESYFGESVSEDSMQTLLESAKNKSGGIFKRIWKGLKTLWKKITNFFNKLLGRSKKSNSKIEAALDKLKNIPKPLIAIALLGTTAVGVAANTSVPGPHFKPVKQILEECWKDEYKNDGFVIADNQPGRKKMASEANAKAIRGTNLNHLFDMMAAAYDNTSVLIKSTGDKKIMSLEDIQKVISKIAENNKFDSKVSVMDIRKSIDKCVDEGHKKGILIQTSDNSIDRAIESFKTIEDSLNAISIDENSYVPEVANLLNSIYGDLVNIVGNTMKAYSDLSNYRTDAIDRLITFKFDIQNDDSSSTDSSKEESKEDKDNESDK